jgi:hypothetical protein
MSKENQIEASLKQGISDSNNQLTKESSEFELHTRLDRDMKTSEMLSEQFKKIFGCILMNIQRSG